MTTLHREAYLPVPLHSYSGQGTQRFFFERLDDVLGMRVLYLTIDAAKAAAHAGLFFDINPFHLTTRHVG
jgi:hypothetical protein